MVKNDRNIIPQKNLIKIFYLLIISTLLFFSCYGKNNKDNSVNGLNSLADTASLSIDLNENIDNLLEGYWDFLEDSENIDPYILEQRTVNYIDLLYRLPEAEAKSHIKSSLKKLEENPIAFHQVLELYEQYLYDPNSPVRDENLYEAVLQAMLDSKHISQSDKERMRFRMEMISKNQPGTTAANFLYTSSDGKSSELKDLNSEYTLLIFYNPECFACKQLIEMVNESSVIRNARNEKRLTILAVYTEENITLWRKYIHDIPSGWINAYDSQLKIENGRLYDLKAMPTIYLLDKDKKVILKDTNFDTLENRLKHP